MGEAVAAERRALMTAEEFFEHDDDGYCYELVDGRLVRMTPAGGRHGVVASQIVRLLVEHVEVHRLGVCGAAEPGFILRRNPDVVRAPDASFVAGAHIPEAGVPIGYWPFAPDLAVEVVSPSEHMAAIQAKITDYLAAGTRQIWVVDPAVQTVDIHRPGRDVQHLESDDELTGGDVLPGFRCPVRRFFQGTDQIRVESRGGA